MLVGGGTEYSVAVEFRDSENTFPTDLPLYWSPEGSPLEGGRSTPKSQESISRGGAVTEGGVQCQKEG